MYFPIKDPLDHVIR